MKQLTADWPFGEWPRTLHLPNTRRRHQPWRSA